MAQAETEKTFDVDAATYFRVVADFEKYPEFVDGMQKVKLDAGPKVTGSEIQSVGHYELSMLSKNMTYDLQLKHDEKALTVSWSLLKSDFFKVNNGAWKIESLGAGKCKVHYSLEVEFNFSVPGFILKNLVKGTLPGMMNSFYERAKKS